MTHQTAQLALASRVVQVGAALPVHALAGVKRDGLKGGDAAIGRPQLGDRTLQQPQTYRDATKTKYSQVQIKRA